MKQSYFQTPRTLHDATFIHNGQAIFRETGHVHYDTVDKIVMVACVIAFAVMVAIIKFWG